MDQFVTLNRRELLKTTTGLLTGCVVAGTPLALIAPARAWAVDLAVLTSAEGSTLMSVARKLRMPLAPGYRAAISVTSATVQPAAFSTAFKQCFGVSPSTYGR